MPRSRLFFAATALLGGVALVAAQPPRGGPPGGGRTHTVTQSNGNLKLVPADRQPPGQARATITEEGESRIISTAGLPDHAVGAFPNRGNPHAIAAQQKRYRAPLNPEVAPRPVEGGRAAFGVAVNGVEFDPGAAEFYGEGGGGGGGGGGGQGGGGQGGGRPGGGGQGDPAGGGGERWQYEALSGAVPLGLDANHAHVQPNGKYHYHGLPTGLLKSLGWKAGRIRR